MTFKVQYFRDGKKIGETPWAAAQGEMVKFARDGLIRHDGDMAVILDMDVADEPDGKEIATVKR